MIKEKIDINNNLNMCRPGVLLDICNLRIWEAETRWPWVQEILGYIALRYSVLAAQNRQDLRTSLSRPVYTLWEYGEKREKGTEKLLEEIMAKNLPDMMKGLNKNIWKLSELRPSLRYVEIKRQDPWKHQESSDSPHTVRYEQKLWSLRSSKPICLKW